MKKLILTVLTLSIFISAHAQTRAEKISTEACNCITTIENYDSLQAKMDRCVPKALAAFMLSDTESDKAFINNADSIKKVIDDVMRSLTDNCPKIKAFILADKEAKYYKMSDSDKANELYTAGNDAFGKDDLKTAEKEYLKAIKEDPEFIYAYDNLGLTYRYLGDYKKAVRYYDKSLEIYPEGSFAIQNQAVAYTYLGDVGGAAKNYQKMMDLYPENPEGYFGMAKVSLMNEDYEKALDYTFYCHKLYVAMQSDYVKDTESLISMIYDKMKEQNKLDVFNELSKKHGITLNQVMQRKESQNSKMKKVESF